jgi:putative DNA primase/helicase
MAPDGMDFNDLLRSPGGAQQIVAILDAAQSIGNPTQGAEYQQPLPDASRPPKVGGMSGLPDNGQPSAATRKRRRAAPADAADTAPGANDRADGAGQPPERGLAGDPGGAAPPGAAAADAAGEEGGDSLNIRLAFFPHTDLGNAERFRERYRGKFLRCAALGWLAWNGHYWRRDGADDKIASAEHDAVRAIQDEAETLKRSGRDMQLLDSKGKPIMMSEKLARWGRSSEQASRLSPIAKRAAPYLAAAADELDADPFKFNVANGTLVIRKTTDGSDYIDFKAHDPADLMTKCSPVTFDPAAKCPTFDRFFAEVQPDPDARRFLMQWQGLSLTGDMSEQKIAVFWGKGKNGKSTFVDVCGFIGGDYSKTVPIETFLNEGRGRNAGQATPDLAILPGVRHLRTSEPDRGAKLAEALIKLATGGEPILARHLNRDYFEFYPQFKLTISGNYRPTIKGADDGIWRRVQLVPWLHVVPAEKRDAHLIDKLKAEASGILNRLLDGLRDWLDNGLRPPAAVAEATADYRRDSDPCGQFLEACVVTAPGNRERSSKMHEVFCAWAKVAGESEWSQKGFSGALKDRGFVSKTSNGVWWLDVALTKQASDFIDGEGRPVGGEVEAPAIADDDVVPL